MRRERHKMGQEAYWIGNLAAAFTMYMQKERHKLEQEAYWICKNTDAASALPVSSSDESSALLFLNLPFPCPPLKWCAPDLCCWNTNRSHWL
jgi:hypothetical protein